MLFVLVLIKTLNVIEKDLYITCDKGEKCVCYTNKIVGDNRFILMDFKKIIGKYIFVV